MQSNIDQQPNAKPSQKETKGTNAFDIAKFMTEFMKDHKKTLDKLAK